jgi:hypothetical protein
VLLLEVADDLALSSLLLVTERTFLSFCAFFGVDSFNELIVD